MAAVLIKQVRCSFQTNVLLLVRLFDWFFRMFPQDMLRNLSLWFFKMFPHDALAGANEIAAMAVKRKLSIVGITDFNMANTEELSFRSDRNSIP